MSETRQELIKRFVIAGHGNLPVVRSMLEGDPTLLNERHQWKEDDFETAIQASAQTGAVHVAEFLLGKGAPLDICTAAMLGRLDAVDAMLKADPGSIKAVGAHGIPLLPHAALSGRVDLLELIWDRGGKEGSTMALVNAVSRGQGQAVSWLLDNASPDLGAKNYEGKSLLELATERNDVKVVNLLREHGAP